MRAWLPTGGTLSDEAWRQRHRAIVGLLWLHVIGLTVGGIIAGYGIAHSLSDALLVAIFGIPAGLAHLGRRTRTGMATLGLLTASALLVHLTNGLIGAHFHFFVMLAVVALYQDWLPFLLGVGYVVVEHGTVGLLLPHQVYDHADAWAEPWKWAFIHGVFVLGLCAAMVARLSDGKTSRGIDRRC